MTVKQMIGVSIIAIVLCCMLLAIGGVWGFIDGDTAWQVFATFVVVAIGLGTTGKLVDMYFKDKIDPGTPTLPWVRDSPSSTEDSYDQDRRLATTPPKAG